MNPRWIAFFRIAVGIFFLAQGLNKLEWLNSSEFLKTNLERYAVNAPPVTQWYQLHVAQPGIEAWTRLIPTGEILIGVSLILGLLTKASLWSALALVVNYHITTGKVFSLQFFSDPYALLLAGSLILLLSSNPSSALALDAAKRPGKKK
ncbi:MAG: DoxX family protein [Ignavibacteriales bacterium]|nr:DoxX family protein [Ignavibacteriales bacterium]